MKAQEQIRILTRAEMEVMNILWAHEEGLTTRQIQACYPEPQPAYSTVATFLKILTNKRFVAHRKHKDSGKTFYFHPLVTRKEYTARTMHEVKQNFFGGSLKSLISFFAEEEQLTAADLEEILSIIHHP